MQGLLREAAVDTELHGVTDPGRLVVILRFAAANRDEREYERPTELDLERQRPRLHIGYGFGGHFCLGAPLARRELTGASRC